MPPRSFTARLIAVEKTRDGRRLVHVYKLVDGSNAKLSTFDVLDALRAGLAREYADRHGEPPPDEPPTEIVRTLAQLDPDSDTSMFGRLVRQVSAGWCDTHDNPPASDHQDEQEGA